MQRWVNEHGDMIGPDGRASYIEDQMYNEECAMGVQPDARDYAEMLFNYWHKSVLDERGWWG